MPNYETCNRNGLSSSQIIVELPSRNASSRDCTIPLFPFWEAIETFGLSAKLRDHGWWWLPLRSASSKCTPAKLECHPSKRTRSGGARCYIPPRHAAFLLRRGRHLSLWRRRTLVVFFPFFSEGLGVRLDTKQRNRRRCTRQPFALADQSWSRSRFRASAWKQFSLSNSLEPAVSGGGWRSTFEMNLFLLNWKFQRARLREVFQKLLLSNRIEY